MESEYNSTHIQYEGVHMAMTISIDEALKREFSEVCADMGLSASAAFNVFAKTVVRERRIPFEISSESLADREARAHERRVAEGILTGYEEFQSGQFVTRADYERGRAQRRETV